MAEGVFIITCPVCRGLIRVKGYGRKIKCPHCGSILYVKHSDNIIVLKRGQIPFPPPDAKPALGAIGGMLLGAALGGGLGAIVGLIIGSSLGSSAKGPLDAEEVE